MWELQKLDGGYCDALFALFATFPRVLCGASFGASITFSSLILSTFGDCPPFQGLNVSVCVAVCVHYGALQRRKMFEKTSDMPGDQAGIHSHPIVIPRRITTVASPSGG